MKKIIFFIILISTSSILNAEYYDFNSLKEFGFEYEIPKEPIKLNMEKYDFRELGAKMIYKFEELPLHGKLKRKPWSGDYWPTYHGGITYRWHNSASNLVHKYGYKLHDMNNMNKVRTDSLSPAEKFDLFMGDKNWSVTNYERQRTRVFKTIIGKKDYDSEYKIPKWEGICHAWAPATITYKNPSPFRVKGRLGHFIKFGSSDIKALLSYFKHLVGDFAPPSKRPKSWFLGSRCNLDVQDLVKRAIEKEWYKNPGTLKPFYDELIGKCQDTHPGAFHITLGNLLGHHKKGFVMDYDTNNEVWNQGIYQYKAQINQRKKLPQPEGNVVEHISITNTVTYVREVPHTWAKKEVVSGNGLRSIKYHYTLHLDKDGFIVGGKWKTKFKPNSGAKDRPDFLWMEGQDPWKLSDFRTGAENRSEHKIDFNFSPIQQLYEISVGERKVPDYKFHKPGDAKRFFKRLARRVIHANRFISTMKNSALDRKERKVKYVRDIPRKMAPAYVKQILKEYNKDLKLMSLIRKKDFYKMDWEKVRAIETNNKAKRSGNECTYTKFDERGVTMGSFVGSNDDINKACLNAKASCLKFNRRGFTCLEGKIADYHSKCTYKMVSFFGEYISSFSTDGLFNSYNCKRAERNCAFLKKWHRRCNREKVVSAF